METKKEEFVSKLLMWHDENRSDFPWRRTSDPYTILVSELLLRKTTRKQVKQIHAQFFSKFPDFKALYKSNIEEIRNSIKSLGMEFIRSIALKKIAEIVVQKYGGQIPNKREEILKLPHVGPYIANAVMCFAYGMDYPLLDTNIIRVITRIFSLKSPKKRPRDDPRMWKIVSMLMPQGKARDLNLAMLDFAASVCLPKKPKCSSCQLRNICDYRTGVSPNVSARLFRNCC